jgi:DNA modification methylase
VTGQAIILRGNALHLPLPDESVDLIITSPPYFALRSYRDSGNHYEGQIGSEATPQAWLEALWACMAEWWRVLKPTGSVFVNLGDKRTGSGGHNNSGIAKSNWHTLESQFGTPRPSRERRASEQNSAPLVTRRNAPDRYNQAAYGRAKSKMFLPHRFAIGCEDGLADPQGIGWIARQDLVWHKLNGLPESVTDRHRDSHEMIFHFTKQERYFAAMDEIRKPNPRVEESWHSSWADERNDTGRMIEQSPNGSLPGSVWPMASEPLLIPQWAKDKYGLSDHFAAFPTELPRKLILGFSPSGICVECNQGRGPVVDKRLRATSTATGKTKSPDLVRNNVNNGGWDEAGYPLGATEATIIGYACACTPYTDHPGTGKSGTSHAAGIESGEYTSTAELNGSYQNRAKVGPWREYHLDHWTPPPTRPAVICDPFGGTGTVALVAKALGRIGISVDLSSDYCRLADWRVNHSGHGKKAESRTWKERQGTLDPH